MAKQRFISQESLNAISAKTLLIWVYMDQAEKELEDVIHYSQQNDLEKQMVKHKLGQMKKLTLDFRDVINREYKNTPEKIEQFGVASDNIEIMVKTDLYNALKKELNL